MPLKLKLTEGNKTKQVIFSKGMGTGCHKEYSIVYEIPPETYDCFRCAVGLHSTLGIGGRIQVEVRFCGKTIFENIFDDKFQATYIKVSIFSGGPLELIVRDKTNNWMNPKNNIVWGESVLLKKPMSLKG